MNNLNKLHTHKNIIGLSNMQIKFIYFSTTKMFGQMFVGTKCSRVKRWRKKERNLAPFGRHISRYVMGEKVLDVFLPTIVILSLTHFNKKNYFLYPQPIA